MAIPGYQTLMLPVLKLASDGKEHKFSQAVEELANEFALTTEERNELLPGGSQAVFNNRVSWARSYLKQAGLLTSPKRGFFTITQKGSELIATKPAEIDTAILEQYPEFIEFKNCRKEKVEGESEIAATFEQDSTLTPEDALAAAYNKLRLALESEILCAVIKRRPLRSSSVWLSISL